MELEKRYQTLFGTKEQVAEIKAIIEQFDTIKARILEHKIILPKTTPEDKREIHYYELELIAPKQDLIKYFQLLKKHQEVLFEELKKDFDYGG